MLNRSILLILTMTLCLIWHIPAKAVDLNKSDKNTITWHIFEAPPLIITKGEERDTGIVDGVRHLLQENIPKYSHVESKLPYKRFLLYAKQGMNICTPYLFKTAERENFLIFSKPAIVFPGLKVILRKETYEKLNFKSELSIQKLFKNHKLRLATNKVRTYGPVIDSVVSKYEKKQLITRHTGSTSLVFRLLSAKRADFMIDFPNRIKYWAQELNVNEDDYISVPISEEYKSKISYIACPNTKWGKEVINRVNTVLDKSIPTQKYLSILQRWSSDYHLDEIEDLYHRYLNKDSL